MYIYAHATYAFYIARGYERCNVSSVRKERVRCVHATHFFFTYYFIYIVHFKRLNCVLLYFPRVPKFIRSVSLSRRRGGIIKPIDLSAICYFTDGPNETRWI